MRAVIYARYSSDRQQETSVDDQIAVCRARCVRDGLDVVASYHDGAVSGSTQVAAREGGKALLADSMAGRVDVVVLEGLDRLSRDQVEQESIVRRLEHRNIRILGVCDGYDSQAAGRKVMRGVRGLINEIYLDDLRQKTHRGMSGQFDRGFIAGGKLYGYDIVRGDAGSKYEINAREADVLRWIFQQVAEGKTFRSIVYRLNEDGVKPPRGKYWSVSTIYGSPIKGTGLVNNTLFAGQYIWNRSQWVKDPDTGKRRRIERPRSEWKQVAVPEARIIDEVTWRRVRSRIDGGRDEFGRKQTKRPVSSLLGGLLRCPRCGGAMVARDKTYYGCCASHDRGKTVCPGYLLRRDTADKRMLTIVRQKLLSKSAARAYEREFERHLRSLDGAESVERARERLGEVEQEIGRLVDAVASVGLSASLSERLRRAEREKASIEDQLSQIGDVMEVPDIQSIFKQQLLNLREALKSDPVAARVSMGEIFGEIALELRGQSQLWAQMKTSPSLLMAAGDALNSGSGDAIPPVEVRIL